MKLLLVEDEKRMADALAELLRQEHYDVDICYQGLDGINAILSTRYDLIILDVMLPGMNGFDIVRTARKEGVQTPILMLTARHDTADEVTGLDSGADDYLTKPFRVDTLLARLRALTRRNRAAEDIGLLFGDLQLDQATAVLFCRTTQQSIRLSEKEYRILEYMFINQSRIITRENLALRVWGYDSNAEYNNVEVYISFTRKKLSFIDSQVEIKAVRGLGYELRMKNV